MKQHYVPEFLLAAWTDRAGDGKLEAFRLDIPQLAARRWAPAAVAREDDLLSLTRDRVGYVERHALETDLTQSADDRAADVRRKLIDGGPSTLTLHDWTTWAVFLLSLRLRQPRFVQQMRDQGAAYLRAGLAEDDQRYVEHAGPDEPERFEDWVEAEQPGLIENFGLSVFPQLMLDPRIVAKVAKLRWWVWDLAGSKHDLLLGDDPCIISPGLDAPEVLIGLPLGPRHAFLASRGDEIEGILRSRTDATHLARWLNEQTVAQARQRIFAVDRTAWGFIDERRGLATVEGES